jgi:hypothetical protein
VPARRPVAGQVPETALCRWEVGEVPGTAPRRWEAGQACSMSPDSVSWMASHPAARNSKLLARSGVLTARVQKKHHSDERKEKHRCDRQQNYRRSGDENDGPRTSTGPGSGLTFIPSLDPPTGV